MKFTITPEQIAYFCKNVDIYSLQTTSTVEFLLKNSNISEKSINSKVYWLPTSMQQSTNRERTHARQEKSSTKTISVWFQRRISQTYNDILVDSNASIIQISKHFEDQLLRLLVAAGFVSLVLGILTQGLKWGWIEGFSIFFAVALVVFVASIDDYVHQRQFQLIKGQQRQKQLRVYRAGKLYEIDAREVMVGDVIEIMTNDRIEVDGILLSGQDLTMDQSEINGQANQIKKRVPITYERHEGANPFILSSSKVIHGMGIMLVMAVGKNSYHGRLISKLHNQRGETPLKLKIADLSQQINNSSVIVGIITFSSLLFHYIYQCSQQQNPLDAFLSKQTLRELVEAILVTFTIDVALPESLPLSVTLSLAHAVQQLHKSNIFVKYLNDAETMGGIDCLCIAKTGFMTKNLLSVAQIYVEDHVTGIISRQIMSQDTCRILNLGIIMNTVACPKFNEDSNGIIQVEHEGNKTECALLQMAFRMGYNYQRFRLNSRVKRIYSSGQNKKKMATIYRAQTGKLYLFVKGSTGFLLPYCQYYINKNQQIEFINNSARTKIQQSIKHFGSSNLRTVTIAYKEVNSIPNKWGQVEKNLILIAIVGIKDTIRKGVRPVIKECGKKGINVRMLSNEGRYTAIGAAKEAGILDKDWKQKEIDYTLIEGSDFRQLVGGLAKSSQLQKKSALDNFKIIIESLKVIYRASEEDKFLLTRGLKECGKVVAVAGNGTGDTNALREADVSLAMSGSANTAKQASDVVFLDDNFGSIIKTVKWGRHVFHSVKKFLVLQLTINLVAAVMTLLGAVFLGQGPIHPLQMLWINLLIDILGSVAIILQQPKQSQTKSPYSKRDKILTYEMVKMIGYQGFIQVICLSIILFKGPDLFNITSSMEVVQHSKETIIHSSIFFNTFVMFQIFNQFNARELNFQKYNVFQGLLQQPLQLCFTISSLIMQLLLMKYGGHMFHVTELSFKENLFCIVIGSLSIFWLFLTKIILPEVVIFSWQKIQIGKFKFQLKKAQTLINDSTLNSSQNGFGEPNFQLMSLQFCSFLAKKRTKMQAYSYMDPLQTLKSGETDQSEEQEMNPSSSIYQKQ